MIRRHVLAALAAGVEAGNDDVARETVARTDWVLRGPARRKLEHALIDATLLTGEHGAADPEAMRHVQRVAALNVAARFDVDANDRTQVAAAYATLGTPTATATPIATILAASAAALVLLLVIGLGVWLRTPDGRPFREPPLASGAFFHGGTPARDAELEHFVVEELSTLVIETDADRRGSREGWPRGKHLAELRDSRVIAARGPGLARAWRDLLTTYDRWPDVSRRSRDFQVVAMELGERALAVSEQFAALGIGLYLQADVLVGGSGARAMIFVYAVEEVVFVRAGTRPRRVLGLRRLDRLNLRLALLGRQDDELGDPVVLLDQIDHLVADRVLPTLYASPYPLGDATWRSSGSGRMLAARAGEAIRRELVAALGDSIHDEVARERIVERMIAASVRRHEARHGVDNERAIPLRLPAALATLLGPRDAANRQFALRARAELAAYTSQIGNDPVTPQFALWNLASQAFNRDRWGSAESYAAVVVIEGLARQLGITQRPVVVAGQLDRSRLAALAEPLAAQSSDKLRTAARKLWIELYGEPMLPIVDRGAP